MARYGKIPAVVREIVSAANRAAADGFNAIEIQCETRDHAVVNIAIAAAAAALPDMLDDDTVSEHWEPCSYDSELIPTWYVPVRPAGHRDPLDVGSHNSGQTVFISVDCAE